jgi:hypothetical protein
MLINQLLAHNLLRTSYLKGKYEGTGSQITSLASRLPIIFQQQALARVADIKATLSSCGTVRMIRMIRMITYD